MWFHATGASADICPLSGRPCPLLPAYNGDGLAKKNFLIWVFPTSPPPLPILQPHNLSILHQSQSPQTIGAGSLNQAMKAMVLARRYLQDDGIDVIFYPEFVDLDFDGREVTAIKLIVEPR